MHACVRLFAWIILALYSVTPLLAQDGRLIDRMSYVIEEEFIDVAREVIPDVDTMLQQVRIDRFTYRSDGLQVKGIIAEPKEPGRYPALIFNRGGNRDFGKLNDSQVLHYLAIMAKWGYVVVASQYRGADGGEGQDEFGGMDVNDVLNLIPLLEQLPMVDTARIGMVGCSRGGLMTYLALTRTTRIKAAVVRAGVTDSFRTVSERPSLETGVFAELIPDYAQHRDQELRRRSPVLWADELCTTTPILILHGTSDWRVSPRDAMDMAGELYRLKRPFRLVLYEGADHMLSEFRAEANATTREFLDHYVRDGKQLPDLEPHGR